MKKIITFILSLSSVFSLLCMDDHAAQGASGHRLSPDLSSFDPEKCSESELRIFSIILNSEILVHKSEAILAEKDLSAQVRASFIDFFIGDERGARFLSIAIYMAVKKNDPEPLKSALWCLTEKERFKICPRLSQFAHCYALRERVDVIGYFMDPESIPSLSAPVSGTPPVLAVPLSQAPHATPIASASFGSTVSLAARASVSASGCSACSATIKSW